MVTSLGLGGLNRRSAIRLEVRRNIPSASNNNLHKDYNKNFELKMQCNLKLQIADDLLEWGFTHSLRWLLPKLLKFLNQHLLPQMSQITLSGEIEKITLYINQVPWKRWDINKTHFYKKKIFNWKGNERVFPRTGMLSSFIIPLHYIEKTPKKEQNTLHSPTQFVYNRIRWHFGEDNKNKTIKANPLLSADSSCFPLFILFQTSPSLLRQYTFK